MFYWILYFNLSIFYVCMCVFIFYMLFVQICVCCVQIKWGTYFKFSHLLIFFSFYNTATQDLSLLITSMRKFCIIISVDILSNILQLLWIAECYTFHLLFLLLTKLYIRCNFAIFLNRGLLYHFGVQTQKNKKFFQTYNTFKTKLKFLLK